MRANKDRNPSNSGNESEPEELSKTKKKQQSAELQDLGLELSRLSSGQLDSLNLDIELRAALEQARKIKAGGAFKRQIKFIGGLLREMDAEPVRAKLNHLKYQSGAAVRHHHLLEKWRDRLLAEGDTAVGALMEQFPAIDCQQLRQLVRNARKEVEQGNPPRVTRILYQYLREYIH
ncbi:MAG: ribosome biogenesis factor YjgA [Methylococcales bacterium]